MNKRFLLCFGFLIMLFSTIGYAMEQKEFKNPRDNKLVEKKFAEDIFSAIKIDGKPEAVKRFIDNGIVDINKVENEDGQTPICFICSEVGRCLTPGAVKIIEILLLHSNKETINKKDKRNRTPLWYSCSSGSKETILWLLEKGASKSLPEMDDGKITPIDIIFKKSCEYRCPENRIGYKALLELFEKHDDQKGSVKSKIKELESSRWQSEYNEWAAVHS